MLLLVLLVSAPFGCTQRRVRPTGADDSRLQAFLPQWEKAQSRFINGDATLWKQNASHRDDATILGGFGGYEKGWNEVGQRYDWASSHFQESGATEKFEYLNTGVSGDLAFTVGIEHQEGVQMVDQEKPAPRALRVTQIFRREDGVWKLLHRHADPLIEKKGGRAAELQRTGDDPQRIPAELHEAIRARDEAVAKKDASTWDRMTMPDFIVVRPEGKLMNKAERLAQLKAQNAEPRPKPPQEQLIRYGDTVIRQLQDTKGTLWIDVWVKDGQTWRVASGQGTPLTQ